MTEVHSPSFATRWKLLVDYIDNQAKEKGC
jgi:hypothetical protein